MNFLENACKIHKSSKTPKIFHKHISGATQRTKICFTILKFAYSQLKNALLWIKWDTQAHSASGWNCDSGTQTPHYAQPDPYPITWKNAKGFDFWSNVMASRAVFVKMVIFRVFKISKIQHWKMAIKWPNLNIFDHFAWIFMLLDAFLSKFDGYFKNQWFLTFWASFLIHNCYMGAEGVWGKCNARYGNVIKSRSPACQRKN